MHIVSVKTAISFIKAYGLKFRIDEITPDRGCICIVSSSGRVYIRSNYAFIGYIQRLLF